MRLRRLLLILEREVGHACDRCFPLPTLRLLARMVDSSPETVCRILARMREQSLLSQDHDGRVHIDGDALLRSQHGHASRRTSRVNHQGQEEGMR